MCLFSFSFAQQEKIREVENIPDGHVYVLGESIRVKGDAKEVLVLGGDAYIEGNIEGDVAAIGGTVYQKENSFIGGDIIVIGGSYKPESSQPKRNTDKQTIMYAGYEDVLKNTFQNPASVLTPEFSITFLALRVLVCLFWFVIALAMITIAPGAISRAVVRFQLSTLHVSGIGALSIIVGIASIALLLTFFEILGVILLFMALLVFVMSLVFGRVVLQASVGKWLQKKYLPKNYQSETISILIGSVFWTIILSLPYIWTIAFFFMTIASLGLILTARTPNNWQKP
jgi:hypothetical protein